MLTAASDDSAHNAASERSRLRLLITINIYLFFLLNSLKIHVNLNFFNLKFWTLENDRRIQLDRHQR